MLKLVVVDATAESRNRLSDWLTHLLDTDQAEMQFMPRVSVKPLAIQELKFNSAPDVCILGSELLNKELTAVASIKKLLPETPLLVVLSAQSETLAIVEHLALLGADDTMSDNISTRDLYKKIILLAKRRRSSKIGQLVLVDSGKGGVGVSTVAAALADSLASVDKRVALVDLDFETQDLSRFLQARPFINENLQLLFDGSRPATEEFVSQCLVPVWDADQSMMCMSPCAETEDLYDINASYSRTLVSVLEVLDETFDCVVVDSGSARGAMLKTLYRVADKILVVVDNDPATLFAVADRLNRIKAQMAPSAQLLLVENNSGRGSLSSKLLKTELNLASGLDESSWVQRPLPYCRHASRWPGSSDTPFSLGSDSLVKAVVAMATELHLLEGNNRHVRVAGISSSPKAADRISPIQKLLRLFVRSKKERQEVQTIAHISTNRVDSQVVALGSDSSNEKLLTFDPHLDRKSTPALLSGRLKEQLMPDHTKDCSQSRKFEDDRSENIDGDQNLEQLFKRANIS